jgi:hypothetical protein
MVLVMLVLLSSLSAGQGPVTVNSEVLQLPHCNYQTAAVLYILETCVIPGI